MAIFTEVTENERITDRHLRGIHHSTALLLWRFWKSVYDLDFIEIGLAALYGFSDGLARLLTHAIIHHPPKRPKLTHPAARLLCDSWATCFKFSRLRRDRDVQKTSRDRDVQDQDYMIPALCNNRHVLHV